MEEEGGGWRRMEEEGGGRRMGRWNPDRRRKRKCEKRKM